MDFGILDIHEYQKFCIYRHCPALFSPLTGDLPGYTTKASQGEKKGKKSKKKTATRSDSPKDEKQRDSSDTPATVIAPVEIAIIHAVYLMPHAKLLDVVAVHEDEPGRASFGVGKVP